VELGQLILLCVVVDEHFAVLRATLHALISPLRLTELHVVERYLLIFRLSLVLLIHNLEVHLDERVKSLAVESHTKFLGVEE